MTEASTEQEPRIPFATQRIINTAHWAANLWGNRHLGPEHLLATVAVNLPETRDIFFALGINPLMLVKNAQDFAVGEDKNFPIPAHQYDINKDPLDRLIEKARQRAIAKGANEVTPYDLLTTLLSQKGWDDEIDLSGFFDEQILRELQVNITMREAGLVAGDEHLWPSPFQQSTIQQPQP